MRTETPVEIKLEDYQPYPFQIEHVSLVFQLDPSRTHVTAEMKVRRIAEGDFVLDGVGLSLESISIDGKTLGPDAYKLDDQSLTLLSVPDDFKLVTQVTIDPSANTELSGLYISGERFCTQCEATGFRRITYWPDRPDVMSRFSVLIAADKAACPVLLSNGTPGASGDTQDGRHFATWDDPHPKPSYLFALCAGDYDIYRDTFNTMSGQTIDLAIHVDKGDAARAEWAMDSLKASMKWDEDTFGREYDLGVFNIVAVRDFNFGAMENKGLNVFNSAYVLADEDTATDADFEAIESIVGHEYFHNWTGNRITCRDWFQLCLKEGLTVFRDQEFSADMRSRPVQRIKDVIRLRAAQFPEDGGPLAHPVRPSSYASIDNLYTATVYEKGAELIRMLKTLIGDDAFAAGMQIYFDRYDGSATTIEHFYSCFEEASGKDLSDFRRWYSQPGTPRLHITQDWDEAAGRLTVTIRQSNPETPRNKAPQPLPMPLRLAAFSANGDKLKEETLTLAGETTHWSVDKLGARPLVSVNRGFSAPVKLENDLDRATRLATARIDDDPFNRWDMLQSLLREDMLAMAYHGQPAPDSDLISAVGDAVRGAQADPAFAALLTRLPGIGEVLLDHVPADPVALSDARLAIEQALGETLADVSADILAQPSPAPFRPDAAQAGQRALRTAMIALVGAADTPKAASQLKTLFDGAPNMTESLAALWALARGRTQQKTAALAAFATRWDSNQLVMDKWFGTQAAFGAVEDVEALMQHPAFSLTNPNRVRSVVGVFAMQNLANFHRPDGAGYRIVTRAIKQADERNPALAARLLTAFEQWRSLTPQLQDQAKTALEALQSETLSENAADIISRTLS
ncbi:MAG: aminopeptidase N [Pseudomonadota bacterium]